MKLKLDGYAEETQMGRVKQDEIKEKFNELDLNNKVDELIQRIQESENADTASMKDNDWKF